VAVGLGEAGTSVSNVAWFAPGLVVSAVVALAVCGRVANLLGTRPFVGWLLVFSLGTIVAATLTPIHEVEHGVNGVGTCDLSRFGLAPLADLRSLNDTSLNVLLFIPLGVAIGFLPDGRRKVLLAAGAVALPFVIEGTQLLATSLHRGCQSADVSDNLTGLALGLIVGLSLQRFAGLVNQRA
jgi:glycopeptide antibiotics resistance protein